MANTNAEIYIDKFIQLEHTVRTTYNLHESDSISYYLRNDGKYRRFWEDIKYCQEVRNWLHHNKKVSGKFAIVPNDAMIEFIDNLIDKIAHRPKCSDVCVKRENIYWQGINGKVQEAMIAMRKNCFTHIPIIDNDIVVGIFDENSVFNYLADNEIVMIDSNLKFADIIQYISIDDREMESFVFLPYNSYVEELEESMEMSFKKGERIGIALLTSNGKRESPLMGIVTPWDIIQSNR